MTANAQVLSIFKDIFEEKKPSSLVALEEDLLVLSCCLYRLKKENNGYENGMGSLTSPSLIGKIKDVDYVLAADIKNYYIRKLLFLSIKDELKTNFRRDLLNFVNGNHYNESGKFTYPENYLGLAYKLPYFYDYDNEFEFLYEPSSTHKVIGERKFNGVIDLEFIRTMKKYNRYNNNIEFWFMDNKNNKVMIPLEKHNPMLGLFEHMAKRGKISVSGSFNTKAVDKFEFLIPNKWEFDLSKI